MTTESAVLDDTDVPAEQPEERVRHSKVADAISQGRRAGESAIKVKTLIVSFGAVAVVAVVGVLGWLVHAKAGDADELRQQAADRAHAEQVATDYATGAANMDVNNLDVWQRKLTSGTTPDLANRLTQAAASMKQIIVPLQWTSTANPITAKVLSDSNGIYSVDCFVDVVTKNSQAPSGIESTATYRLTVDSNHNWVITDISGIDSALARTDGHK